MYKQLLKNYIDKLSKEDIEYLEAPYILHYVRF